MYCGFQGKGNEGYYTVIDGWGLEGCHVKVIVIITFRLIVITVIIVNVIVHKIYSVNLGREKCQGAYSKRVFCLSLMDNIVYYI